MRGSSASRSRTGRHPRAFSSTKARSGCARRSSTIVRGAPGDTPVRAWWRDRHGAHERNFVLEELKSPVLQLVPGEKICYVTDVVYHDRNAGRIAELEGARAGQC